MGRRLTAILCLALTALMLMCLPVSFRWLIHQGESRVDDSLVPEKGELITLWLLRDDTDSLSMLKKQLAAFEKENKQLRVLLRNADISEMNDAAALPDAILFGAGDIMSPESFLTPLADDYGCSEYAKMCGEADGLLYALPLWYAQSVLAIDVSLLGTDAPERAPTPAPLLPLMPVETETPQPAREARDERTIWQELIERRAVKKPTGIALLQLMCACPADLRGSLIASVSGDGLARCLKYREATATENARLIALPPASDSILLMGLCRGGEGARRLLSYLLSDAVQSALWQEGLFAAREGDYGLAGGSGVTLANAFAGTRDEINEYCLRAFMSGEDPVAAMMSLR